MLSDASRKKMNVMVHSDCRKTFTDKRKLKQKAEDVQVKTRNKTESFSFSQNCLYCNETFISDKKHPSRKNYREQEIQYCGPVKKDSKLMLMIMKL